MRKALGVVIATLVGILALAGFSVPAAAAPGDEVRSFTIDATVGADGVVHVKETIAYHFGSTGRRGIYRDLITREPWVDDDAKDQKYEVSNIKVDSPSGAPDTFEETTTKENADRNQSIRIKIGDEDKTVPGVEATYVISYDLRGVLRHFDDHSELYWDATGAAWDAPITQTTVNVTVPQGVQKVTCFQGAKGSTSPCVSSLTGGKAVFRAANLPRGHELTIVAAITVGAVQNDRPIVVDAPDWKERAGINLPALIGSGLVSLVALVIAFVYAATGNKDKRFAELPPGTFPPSGIAGSEVKNELDDDQIPVAFAPPNIPVAEAGLLIDSKANTTEVAATLIDMAVRGGVRIENDGGAQRAVLLDGRVATAPHEQALLQGIFPGLTPGAAITLERRPVGDSSMLNAAIAMWDALRKQVDERQWYVRLPRWIGTKGGSVFKSGTGCACGGMIAIWVFGAGIAGTATAASTGGLGRALVVAVPVIAVIIAVSTWMRVRSRGQKTGAGRAVADQVIGFRKYLATAEAEQLRFEEGEDIFSKYLPWAIAFDLADRWQKVCQRLVDAGQLTPDPYWYVGPSYYHSGWSANDVSHTVAQTFQPPPTPSSSGGGGGSSSGFSGGSSGGGGGGGGGGSW
ncbi:DUF2207 domain-containing protein [Kribbella sandramycini]|uniref:DUF2207 domain-containing protein n=1 Tax=Kribbella sandramycini TaxID=60450 RepID=A0A7Y4KYG3_9ACTN|nr:DUF2207 domain-containing protein [Kribbella sandramycini]MBB6569157.1 hypothetical protein [Kribbella sandramycini]NOL41002.1 DUF2207 domain-containing protein [Kribbella sandramycini]